MQFAASVKEQLRSLRSHQRATVLQAIEIQLSHEPIRPTRNRKPLRPNPIAPWELRVGDLRVFYDAPHDMKNVVIVLAIGEKRGDRLVISASPDFSRVAVARRWRVVQMQGVRGFGPGGVLDSPLRSQTRGNAADVRLSAAAVGHP